MNEEACNVRRLKQRLVLAGVCVCLPALMGGCPEFRNELVNVANSAVQGIVLGDVSTDDALDSASRGALSAAIDLFFDQFRADTVR